MTTKEKNVFRRTKSWKNFRKDLIATRNRTCELCDMKYIPSQTRRLQVHHLYPNEYDVLEEHKFKLLCKSCHDLVELAVLKLNSKKGWNPHNKNEWMALLGEFLSNKKVDL